MTLIYLVSEHIRSNTFFHNLKSEAVTKVHLFLQNQVDADIMQSIYLNNKEFINEVEVAVYTTDFHMLYHDAIDNDIVKENPEMIAQILQQKEIEFYIGKYQAVGMVYPFNGQTYIVTAAATMVTDTPTCWSFRKHWSSCSLSASCFYLLPAISWFGHL